MIMKKLILLLFTIPFLAIGQEKGISFEHNTTWAKVKAKAKAEKKHIFVDAFTTWCGPCKWMAANVFPQEHVGTFFNENFVNLKIQMDETAEDNADVKSWREEAKRFAKDYKIAAYPTFLIFDPNGELVHRIVGGGEADQFIALAKEGLDPNTQYETLVKKFNANPTDKAIARSTAKAAVKAYDRDLTAKAVESVINNSTADELLENETLKLVSQNIGKPGSKAFSTILANKEKVDAKLGAGKTDELLSVSIINSEIAPVVMKSEEDILDQTVAEVSKKYPNVSLTNSIASFKPNFYARRKNWPAFRDAVQAFINIDPSKVNSSQLNSFAWAIFENCDDPSCVESALAWSKKSLESENNPALIDTYANLLHKVGKTKEAIEWQEKAIAMVDDASKAEYQETLEKMKKGEPTWVK
ncbi:thioredoxin family protein [Sphingobacterium cellulitidis]|nr:thioredoxin family protein [Sphingobacterium cellulitidis]